MHKLLFALFKGRMKDASLNFKLGTLRNDQYLILVCKDSHFSRY